MITQSEYASLTWPEVREAAAADLLVIVPTAMTEDHGPHLPLDTDIVLCAEVCRQAAARMVGEVLVTPPVNHGYSPHHMDFPGSLTIDPHALIDYTLGVTMSLVEHGFRRILIVNGHGSNTPFMEIAARLTVIRSEGKAVCAALSYWNLGRMRKVAQQVMEPGEPVPGHAAEFETSMYLTINPLGVKMDQAVADWLPGQPIGVDPVAGPDGDVVAYVPYWSTMYSVGVKGDATKATAAKGEKLLEAGASGLADLARRLRAMPVPTRVNHH